MTVNMKHIKNLGGEAAPYEGDMSNLRIAWSLYGIEVLHNREGTRMSSLYLLLDNDEDIMQLHCNMPMYGSPRVDDGGWYMETVW